MSNIVMTRVDARLVHGQVATRWTKTLGVKQIVIVDNKTSKDSFLIELLEIAAPVGVKVIVYNEAQALNEWQKDGFGEKPTILLFQNVDTAKRAYDSGIHYKRINIGQVPKAPNRKNANNTVHLSEQELDELIDLFKGGVEVYFHPTPEDKLVTLDKVVQKMRP